MYRHALYYSEAGHHRHEEGAPGRYERQRQSRYRDEADCHAYVDICVGEKQRRHAERDESAASVFGEVPLAGLVLNIAAVPAFAVIFPLVLLLSLPPLLALPGSAVAASASEAILTVFQEAIERGAELFSGALIFDSALFMLSVFIFSAACALRCGAGLKRSAAAALIFMFFMTYSAAM